MSDDSSAAGDPGASSVDEILADLEGHAESAWRLQFASLAAEIDQYLTAAHATMNDRRVYDASAEWTELVQLSDRAGIAIMGALRRAATMFLLADRQAPHG